MGLEGAYIKLEIPVNTTNRYNTPATLAVVLFEEALIIIPTVFKYRYVLLSIDLNGSTARFGH